MSDIVKIGTALISVFDKSGLESFVPGLVEHNPELIILSSGGTYRRVSEILKDDSKQRVVEVAQYSGVPEMKGGLVKTLVPHVHAGILGDRSDPEHEEYVRSTNARFIDMVVCNLYPFEQAVSNADATYIGSIKNTDIGGPAMVRAAAKNERWVVPVVDPNDYAKVLDELREHGGVRLETRLEFADKAFGHTRDYDAAICAYRESAPLTERLLAYRGRSDGN